jgi:glycosyltransferase involved in cell wall biosynthesis
MISVFTPTNNDKYLLRAYKSLLSQTYQDWEWVVLTNGDVSVPEFSDDRVKVFHTEETGMVGTLKRLACSYCTGEYLVELDHDDELTPDCLEEISKCT